MWGEGEVWGGGMWGEGEVWGGGMCGEKGRCGVENMQVFLFSLPYIRDWTDQLARGPRVHAAVQASGIQGNGQATSVEHQGEATSVVTSG